MLLIKYGPLSEEMFVDLSSSSPTQLKPYIKIENSYIKAKAKFNDDEFTDNDIELMDKVIELFGSKKSDELVAYTHRENSLWYNIAKEKNITLENQVPDNLSVWADKNALESVVRNLISNALKFTYPKGKVVVFGGKEDNMVRLMIRDNGIGIQKAVLDKLFDIEHEISSDGTNGEKGTGLGLVLSHELIRQCNGTLSVESQPGQGSVFTIELPVCDNSHLSGRNYHEPL